MHPTQFAPKDLKNEPSLLGKYYRKTLKAFEELSNKYLFCLGFCYKVGNQTLLRCVHSSKTYIFSGLVKEQQAKWSP